LCLFSLFRFRCRRSFGMYGVLESKEIRFDRSKAGFRTRRADGPGCVDPAARQDGNILYRQANKQIPDKKRAYRAYIRYGASTVVAKQLNLPVVEVGRQPSGSVLVDVFRFRRRRCRRRRRGGAHTYGARTTTTRCCILYYSNGTKHTTRVSSSPLFLAAPSIVHRDDGCFAASHPFFSARHGDAATRARLAGRAVMSRKSNDNDNNGS